MSIVTIQNDNQFAVDDVQIKLAIDTVIKAHEVDSDSEVTVVFTTNDAVKALNQQHRQVDAPTDVLSFPADPLPPELVGDDAPYLGDLVIAYPYAKAQAERLKHNLDDSLALLVVHGTLHLLDYDHDTLEHRAEMWQSQKTALDTLGIDDSIVPTLEDSDHA